MVSLSFVFRHLKCKFAEDLRGNAFQPSLSELRFPCDLDPTLQTLGRENCSPRFLDSMLAYIDEKDNGAWKRGNSGWDRELVRSGFRGKMVSTDSARVRPLKLVCGAF